MKHSRKSGDFEVMVSASSNALLPQVFFDELSDVILKAYLDGDVDMEGNVTYEDDRIALIVVWRIEKVS